MDVCVLCKEPLASQPSSILTEKGCAGIRAASELREEMIDISPGQSVHQTCRRDYCNKKSLETSQKRQRESADPGPSAPPSRRSQTTEFIFDKHCLFCGQPAKTSWRKRGCDVFPVRTKDFQSSVEQACRQRMDKWGEVVLGRVEFAQDLHAADAIYHNVCNINFRTGKQIPAAYQSNPTKKTKVGRPQDPLKSAAFENVVQYLIENDDEQITLTDLQAKMAEFCDGVTYDIKYLKDKLRAEFGETIMITTINNKPNVVTFKSTAASILQSFYAEPHLDDDDAEKMRIIATAASLIKTDILNMEATKSMYPSADDMASTDKNKQAVPDSLWTLLRLIFSEKNATTKLASIGQAIVQAARPRLILSPLQLGLAVQMHQHFGSRFLVDTLSSLGFCSSYSEVQRFEASAAVTYGTDLEGLGKESFVNYIADNVDHNLRTIDGHNTFHAMGMIATVTPAVRPKSLIPRLTTASGDLKAAAWIEVSYFRRQQKELPDLKYTELPDFQYQDPTADFDLLWRLSWTLRCPRPGWSGTMQAVHKGHYPGVSSFIFLPMIDMDPTDMSCVYSTLKFVCKEARRHDIKAVLTFDQPLGWKAQVIICHDKYDDDFNFLILRLGVFHVEMSFLGCIGHIMEGSGLREILECVYAGNTVCHMLSGKAVARAIRGHELVITALYALLAEDIFGIQLPTMEDEDQDVQTASTSESPADGEDGTTLTCFKQALSLFDSAFASDLPLEEVTSHAVDDVKVQLSDKRKSLASSRTAALWFQYIDMEKLLKDLIKAERTGNWSLHLKTLHSMLPYFAASGHNLYAKSIHLYLQQMSQLHENHPDVLQKFNQGYHVARRSDRYWGGLSTDLCIEQVLMRSVKTTGGLTRGRGLTELQRAQWLLSMPACAYINQAMQEFTGTVYSSSEQHKEISSTRQKRDTADIKRLVIFLRDRNPFVESENLRSIETGLTFDRKVTADTAKEVGLAILKEMPGKLAESFVFRRKSQVVSMNDPSALKVDGDTIHVDSQILFQRFVAAANRVTENSTEIFRFELSTYPSSLFEPSGLLRSANKASLADCLWLLVDGKDAVVPDIRTAHHVLDGGSLLHKVPWSRGQTFDEICNVYVNYVKRKYPYVTVVFDGYPDAPTTKDMAHMRRNKGVANTSPFLREYLYFFILSRKIKHDMINFSEFQ